jgi:hypothetical protein
MVRSNGALEATHRFAFTAGVNIDTQVAGVLQVRPELA